MKIRNLQPAKITKTLLHNILRCERIFSILDKLSDGCSLLPGPHAIVFDNCQDVQNVDFHEQMTHALDILPDGIRIFLISRNDPPHQYARLIANRKLETMSRKDISFSLE